MNNNLKLTYKKGERLHALDALRAVMMMLGIVLHSTEPYSMGNDVFWPKDPWTTHASLNFIFSIIHIFRMPTFFLLAGFFGALLYYDRGPEIMLNNRFKRIILPFVVFVLLLHPLIVTVIKNTSDVFHDPVSELVTTLTVLPQITYHLWFLYYLIFITLFSFVLAKVLGKASRLSALIIKAYEWLMRKRAVFILIFSIIIFLMLVWIWDTWVPTRVSFVPDPKVLLFYSIFYFLGWLLFKSKHLLASFMKFDWGFVTIAVIVFTLRFIFRPMIDDVLYGALNAILVWFFLFGITGLFIRYASRHSTRMRYLSDASYWVYLVHLPLTAFFPALIVDWPIPAFVKFLIVMIATTIVCFVSYHFIVRATFIGQFLNGRKYPLKRERAL